ncbi:MAG: hypothetical protein IJW16_07445 [Clostridia bacterium]|nr:hypothetical protein [Clostridia bacterium]
MEKKNKNFTSSYSKPVRILALVMAGLVASGVLVYIATFIIETFVHHH